MFEDRAEHPAPGGGVEVAIRGHSSDTGGALRVFHNTSVLLFERTVQIRLALDECAYRADVQHEVLTVRGARAEFDPTVTYLNTATYGLPPRRSWAELERAQAAYRRAG